MGTVKSAISEVQNQIDGIKTMVQDEVEAIQVVHKEAIDEVWRQIRDEMEKHLEEQKQIVNEVKEENSKLAEIVEVHSLLIF